jgi:mRNA-degrading endonuclease toxin of MazEF toxin-antitoxin module
MTVPGILKELKPQTGRFPMNAMPAVVARREAIAPKLLCVVAAFARGGGGGLKFHVSAVTCSQ